MKTIYCFVNEGSPGWYICVALCDCGSFLASHCCSAPAWGPHDMGVTSEWKHEHYKKHAPDGYQVVWVDGKPLDHPGVKAAYDLHLKRRDEIEAAEKADA